jgi:hypothetical protein
MAIIPGHKRSDDVMTINRDKKPTISYCQCKRFRSLPFVVAIIDGKIVSGKGSNSTAMILCLKIVCKTCLLKADQGK